MNQTWSKSRHTQLCKVTEDKFNLFAEFVQWGVKVRMGLIYFIIQSPVVQSVVSCTSSLRVILLTVLVDSIHNILIFFAEKCE